MAAIATWPTTQKGRFKPIQIAVRGNYSLSRYSGGAHRHPTPTRDANYEYEYAITIDIDADDKTTISNEWLAISKTPTRGGKVTPVLRINRTPLEMRVSRFDLEELSYGGWIESRKAFVTAARQQHERHASLPLIPLLDSHSFLIHVLTHEFEHLERVNIQPDRIRLGDPVGTVATIQPSGLGLVRTLAALHDGTARTNSSLTPKEAFRRIMERVRIGVDGFHSLTFHRDLEAARYLASASLGQTPKSRRTFPIGKLSDGTLKWLALLTHIETTDLFSVEEPENYLHPMMQREAIRFLREFASSGKGPRSVVVTTHSETIISALGPEELVVVRDIDGQTRASRVREPEMLINALSDTGFGLGHIYLSGELFDPDSLVSAEEEE